MPFLCPSKSNELNRSIAAQVPIATTPRPLGFNDSFDGDVGLDRTPHGVRSPVAHRTINKSSVAGAGFNYRASFPPSPFLSPFLSPYRRIPVIRTLFSPFFSFTTKFVFRRSVATSNHSLAGPKRGVRIKCRRGDNVVGLEGTPRGVLSPFVAPCVFESRPLSRIACKPPPQPGTWA